MPSACGGEGRADAPYTVRDSAGIPVVENRAPTWAPGEAWLVDAEPVLTLGSLDGPEETQFFDVATVRLRDDGALLVADAGNHRISAFGSNGIYLWSQGREGEGAKGEGWPEGPTSGPGLRGGSWHGLPRNLPWRRAVPIRRR